MFAEKYGGAAQERIELRRRQALAGIPATLAAIKQIAETDEPGSGPVREQQGEFR
jgi:hypothetical protein